MTSTEAGPASVDIDSGSERGGRLFAITVVLAILAGIGLRLFILTHYLGVLDSDEAVGGLVARRLVSRGEFPVFYWPSNYGGTFEAGVVAVPFALFGSSVLGLKMLSIVWHAAACCLLWRIGRRLIDARTGVVAALILWVWPANYVWWSTKFRGYGALIVFGLSVVLYAVRLAERPDRTTDWLGLGLVLGLGWWTTPQIAYLAAPAGCWLVLQNWRAVRHAFLAVPTAFLGAAPWIAWNINHGWAALHFSHEQSFGRGFVRFWSEALPMALGLRVPYSLRWVNSGLFPTLYLVALALGCILLIAGRRRLLLVALGIGMYPFLFAQSPFNGTAEGRYLYCLSPLIALLLASALRKPTAVAAGLAVLFSLTVGGLSAMPDGYSPYAPDRPMPQNMGPLIRTLRDAHVEAVYAHYWLAYRLTFESQEQVIAAGVPYNRYPPYEAYVRAHPRAAWVFVAGSPLGQRFADALEVNRNPYRVLRPRGFSVYVPERTVAPEDVKTVFADVPN